MKLTLTPELTYQIISTLHVVYHDLKAWSAPIFYKATPAGYLYTVLAEKDGVPDFYDVLVKPTPTDCAFGSSVTGYDTSVFTVPGTVVQ